MGKLSLFKTKTRLWKHIHFFRHHLCRCRRRSSSWKCIKVFCIRGRLLGSYTDLASISIFLSILREMYFEWIRAIKSYNRISRGRGKKFSKTTLQKFITPINPSINYFSSNSIRNLISSLPLVFKHRDIVFFFSKGKINFKNNKILPNSRNHFYPSHNVIFNLPYFIISHLHCSSRNGHMIDSTNSDNTHVTGGGPINLIRWQFTITSSRYMMSIYIFNEEHERDTTILK